MRRYGTDGSAADSLETSNSTTLFVGTRLYPPEYPYCRHVVFVHLAPSIDGESFDYVKPEFSKAYVDKLKDTGYWQECEYDDLSDKDVDAFTSGNLGYSSEQKITFLAVDILEDVLPGESVLIFVTEEPVGTDYPTVAHFGLQQDQG